MEGALKQMAWAKWKFAAGFGAAVLLAGTATVATMPMADNSNLDDNNGRYQIEGELTYTLSDREMVRNFTLTVNGSNWMIHLTHPKPDPKPDPIPVSQANFSWKSPMPADAKPLELDYRQRYEEEVGLNGSVYTYLYIGKLPPDDLARNNGNAIIEYGDSSVSGFAMFANYVWAGLASGRYFSSITDGVVTPIAGTTAQPRYDRIKAQWQLNKTPPFLPKSIEYFHGKIEPTKDIFHRFVVRPSDSSQRIGELRVLQEKTINGKTFPMVYTYEQFRPKFPGETTTNDSVLQASTTVRARTIRLHAAPDVLPPKLQGETSVMDYRYIIDRQGERIEFPMRPGHIMPDGIYFMSGGRLPEEPDVKALKEFEQERDSRKKLPPPH